LRPDCGCGGRSGEDPVAQDAQVESAATDYQHGPSAGGHFRDRRFSESREFSDVERVIRRADIDQMMRYASLLGGGRLGGADIHPAIDLPRVGVDDFRAQSFGDGDCERGLAGASGTDNKTDARAGPRTNLSHRCGGADFIWTQLADSPARYGARRAFASVVHRRNIRSIALRRNSIWTGRPCGQLVLNSVLSSSVSSSLISGGRRTRPARTEP